MQYGSKYPIEVQLHAIPAMCALRNFFRIHDLDEDIKPWEDSSYEPTASSCPEAAGSLTQGVSNAEMRSTNKQQDEIAEAMLQEWPLKLSRICHARSNKGKSKDI